MENNGQHGYDSDTCNTYRRNICLNDRESVVHGDDRELIFDMAIHDGDDVQDVINNRSVSNNRLQ